MTTDQIIEFMKAPEKLNQETLPLLKELNERYPAFEAGWILYLKNLKNISDSSFEQELIHVAIRIQDRRKLYLLLNQKPVESTLSEVSQEEEESKKLNISELLIPSEYQLETLISSEEPLVEAKSLTSEKTGKKASLIEKFLEAQPKMPPINEIKPASPMESQTPPEEVSDDLITETLALIYSQQGYYKKATQIFEKLSLKYPEKSTYFAGHIEKIKNLMNN